jgi:hypothetical protein
MKRAHKLAVLLATTTVVLTVWGCGGSESSPQAVSGSSQEAIVKGTVTVKGKPATGGEVTFDPANIERPTAKARTAPIGADGTFTVTTLIGQNTVSAAGTGIPRNTNMIELIPGENNIPINVP